jgi:cytoskeletal protein CcmA (bactofilin family)
MRIDARIQGPVHYSGKVTVGPDGAVIGNLYAATIIVEGEVVGDIHAEEALRIAASARIVGNMASPKLAVARGAQLRGSILMQSAVAPAVDLDERAVDVMLSGHRPG